MTELEIASYLDRGLSPTERDRIEKHLVECAECRGNVTGAQQLVSRMRRQRKVLAGLSLLAIAAVAMFIVRPRTGSDNASLERGAPSTDKASIVAYGPIGATMRDTRRFIWGAAPSAVSYRLTVSTADGVTVWSNSGTDTVAVLPATMKLRSSARYVWIVDALISDGSTRSTGLKEFKAE